MMPDPNKIPTHKRTKEDWRAIRNQRDNEVLSPADRETDRLLYECYIEFDVDWESLGGIFRLSKNQARKGARRHSIFANLPRPNTFEDDPAG